MDTKSNNWWIAFALCALTGVMASFAAFSTAQSEGRIGSVPLKQARVISISPTVSDSGSERFTVVWGVREEAIVGRDNVDAEEAELARRTNRITVIKSPALNEWCVRNSLRMHDYTLLVAEGMAFGIACVGLLFCVALLRAKSRYQSELQSGPLSAKSLAKLASMPQGQARSFALSVGLLGHHLVTAAPLLLTVLCLALLTRADRVSGRIAFVVIWPTIVVIRAFAALLRVRVRPAGARLSAVEQPNLYQTVSGLCEHFQRSAECEIYLCDDSRLSVFSPDKWIAINPRVVRVELGLRLLQRLSVDEFRALLAQRLIEGTRPKSTRWPTVRALRDIAQRTLLALAGSAHTSDAPTLLAPAVGYLELVQFASRRAAYRDSLNAQRAAIELCGVPIYLAALRKFTENSLLESWFVESELRPILALHLYPNDVSLRWNTFLTQPRTAEQLPALASLLQSTARGRDLGQPTHSDRVAFAALLGAEHTHAQTESALVYRAAATTSASSLLVEDLAEKSATDWFVDTHLQTFARQLIVASPSQIEAKMRAKRVAV